MSPEELQQRIEHLEMIVRMHQHNGADFTQLLRSQDWQVLGRVIIPTAATSMTLNIPSKQFLRIFIQWDAKSGVSNDYLRFNNDSGSNYTFINNGAAARTSQAQIDVRDAANLALGGFAIIDVVNNISSLVKSVIIHTVDRITGAATAQTFYQIFGTWVNTAAFITRVDLVSSNAQTYPANSSILVLASKE